jgi:hypothetical protein
MSQEQKPKRGRPRQGEKPLTVLQRVRRHRWKQEQKNDAHMQELMKIIRESNV